MLQSLLPTMETVKNWRKFNKGGQWEINLKPEKGRKAVRTIFSKCTASAKKSKSSERLRTQPGATTWGLIL